VRPQAAKTLKRGVIGIRVTLADSVRWMVEQGHISRRQAGQLATG
jgi:hypothetical protein